MEKDLLKMNSNELEKEYKKDKLGYYQQYVRLSASPKYTKELALLALNEEIGEVCGVFRKAQTIEDNSKFIAKYGMSIKDKIKDEISDTLFQLINVMYRFDLDVYDIIDYNLKKLDNRMSPTGEYYFGAGLGLTDKQGGKRDKFGN